LRSLLAADSKVFAALRAPSRRLSLISAVGREQHYDHWNQGLETAKPIGHVVCTAGRLLRLGISRPGALDPTGHERLLLFRGVGIGFGFRARDQPRIFAGFCCGKERVSYRVKLGVLGSGPFNASIVFAVLIYDSPEKPN
jgi:hypothetical protein